MSTFQLGSRPCRCKHTHHETRLVAITGGPGAGKTAILEIAARSFCTHVGVLPEAAGIVFGGGFPRHVTDVGQRAAQRAIFHIQRELEAVVLGEGQVAVALADRGTVDGLAYWPGSDDEFWEELGTTSEAELHRYAAVIHLRTPSAEQGYDHSNRLRIESAADAGRLDDKILGAWARHPNRVVIASEDDFVVKAARALESVKARLPACCRVHTIAEIERP